MNIENINTAAPFCELFPVSETLKTEIAEDMKKNGFDASKPLVIWQGKNLLIDGHTRLLAAKEVGIQEVTVNERDFADEDEAVEYAIRCQKNRRNLEDKDIFQCIAVLDKRNDKNANLRQNLTDATGVASVRSSDETAKTLGIGRGKVEKARTILEKASDEVKEAIRTGDMSINSAYNKTVKPDKGSPESLELATEEIEKIDTVIGIIKERLTPDQIRELIKRLKSEI